jgi:antitoxin MazE
MDIELRKWGNSIGLRIPQKVAQSFGLDEHSIVELTESKGALIITKKRAVVDLEELLGSIPDDFRYPEDVTDFLEGEPMGNELL